MDFEIADKFWKYSESFLTKCLNYDILKPVQSCCFLRATFPWVFFHQSSKEEMIGFSAKTCTALQTQQPSYGILFSALSNLRPDQQSLATTSWLSTLDYLGDRREIRTTTYLMKVLRLIYIYFGKGKPKIFEISHFRPPCNSGALAACWQLWASLSGKSELNNQESRTKENHSKLTNFRPPCNSGALAVCRLVGSCDLGEEGLPSPPLSPSLSGRFGIEKFEEKEKTS